LFIADAEDVMAPLTADGLGKEHPEEEGGLRLIGVRRRRR
jgi:hypothetical protein